MPLLWPSEPSVRGLPSLIEILVLCRPQPHTWLALFSTLKKFVVLFNLLLKKSLINWVSLRTQIKKIKRKNAQLWVIIMLIFLKKECTCQYCNGLHNALFFNENIILTCICKFIVIVCVFWNVCPNIHTHTATNIAYM